MFHMNVRTQLADSMYDLLTQMPVTAISVQKIADNCGVSRRTFYHYFNDKYDLMAFLLYIRGEQLWYKDGDLCSFRDYYTRHIQFEHLPVQVFRNMYEYVGQNDLREFLIIKARQDLRKAFYLCSREEMLQRKELQDIISLLSYGLAAMFEHYVRNPNEGFLKLEGIMKCFPEEYHDVLLHTPPKNKTSAVPAFDPGQCSWPLDMHL